MEQVTHAYDTSLKSLFESHAGEILPHLIPEAEFVEELNSEVLKPPLRADRVYLIKHGMLPCIVQIEMETRADADIAYRLLEYHGILLRKYQEPLISVVIYPFRAKLPESPLRVVIDREEVLVFRFRVIAMWTLHAQYYLDKRVIGMYPLLPTMQGATCELLVQAVDEMKAFYGIDSKLLAERLLWFSVFLNRTTMVTEEDKRNMEETLKQFDSLLSEAPFVQKKMAEAEAKLAEKVAEAEAKAAIELLQQMLVEIVEDRFPPLTELAQQEATKIKEPAILRLLVKQVASARDETTAQRVLTALAA